MAPILLLWQDKAVLLWISTFVSVGVYFAAENLQGL